jgi:hypothetical protein
MANVAEQAWNKVRDKEAGDPEWAASSPDHRARLNMVVGEIQSKGVSSGIAGLEKFEEEVGKLLKKYVRESVEPSADPFAPTVTAPSAESDAKEGEGGKAKPQAKGSGAQEPDPNPEASAKAAGERVEADELHSPSKPSAARPLAAEAPGSGSDQSAPEAADAKKASKRSKAGASKTAAKSSGGSKK